MRWQNRFWTFVTVIILLITVFSAILIIDGRGRQDPSSPTLEIRTIDDYRVERGFDFDVSEGVLYLPTGSSGMAYGEGYELIAVDEKEEELLWTLDHHKSRISAVLEHEGWVLSGSELGHIVAVDGESGEKEWERTFQDEEPLSEVFPTSFNIVEDVLFFGMDDFVIAVEWETGEELWRHRHHDDNVISVAIEEGLVYSASSGGNILAADMEEGEKLWSHANDDMTGTITVQNDILFYGLNDGSIEALDLEDREVIWSQSRHSGGIHALKSVSDIVYSGCSESEVMALNIEDGEKIWNHDYHFEEYSSNGVYSIRVENERVYSLEYPLGFLAVKNEGDLATGISRSLSAFGGFLSSYVVNPLREYWLVALIIGAFVGSTLALLIRDTKKEEPDLRELEHKET